MYNIRQQAKTVKDTSIRVTRNVERFVQAVSLIVLVICGVWVYLNIQMPSYFSYPLAGAISIISYRAAYELFRFFDRDI